MKFRTEQWPMLYRMMDCEIRSVKGADDEELTEFAISSETPVERWFGDEVLSHARGAIDTSYMSRNAAVLVNHDGDRQVGAVRDFEIGDDRKLRTKVKWSRSAYAQEIKQDVDDRIRTQVSVGYRVMKAKITKRGDPEKNERDEITVTRWMPYEMSVVPYAADVVGTGLGRSTTEGEKYPVEVEVEDGEVTVAGKETRALKTKKQLKAEADAAARALADAPDDGSLEVEGGEIESVRQVGGGGGAAAGKKYGPKEIRELLRSLKMAHLVDELEDQPIEEVRARVLTEIATKGVPVGGREIAVDLPKADRALYSYRKAILGAVMIAEGKGHKFDGLEREVHDEVEKNTPDGYVRQGGVFLPVRLGLPDVQERAYPLDSITANEGKDVIFTAQGEFIELLRNRMYVMSLGARILGGLVGPVGFPRQTGAATAVWFVEEASAIADSMLATDLVTLAPKSLMATTGYTRQLLIQGSVDVERMVREDLANIHALALDQACLIGSAASGQPRGIALQSGVGTVDFGAGAGANAAPSFAKLVDMQGVLGDANADRGSIAYMLTPLCAATTKKTQEFTSPGGLAIWQGPFNNGIVAGYKAVASNQVGKLWLNGAPTGGTEHGLFFGNWEELLIGMWNAIEVVVDPYTLKKRAIIEVTTYQAVDCTVRHAPSFVIGQNVIP